MAFKKGHQAWNKLKLNEEFIIQMYKKGIPATKIGKIMRCSYQSIYCILKKNGEKIKENGYYRIGISPGNKLNLDKNRVINLYEKGFSLKEVAKKFNCSDIPVKRILKEQGIKIRNSGFYCIGKTPYNKLKLDEKKIVEMYLKENLSILKLSKIFNCDRLPIRKILRKNNIKIRNSGVYMEGKISPRRLNLPEQEIIDMYNKNISGMGIAEKFGCNDTVIYRILKRNGIKVKELGFYSKGKISPKRLNLPKKKIINMYNKISVTKIAKIFGCSDPIIYMILKRNGIKLRNDGFYKKGEDHPNWQGGKSFEPYDQNWTPAFRRAIRKRDNQVCILCGIHREKLNQTLHVHHINGDKKMNIPQNCLSLCVKCHLSIVHKDDKNKEEKANWIRLFQGKLAKLYDYEYLNEDIVLDINASKIR